jgi:hypothetical protein
VELLAAPRFLPLRLPVRWGFRSLPRLPAVGGHLHHHLRALPASEMAPSGLQPRAQEHGKALDRNPTLCRRHLHKLWRQQPDRAGLRPPATTSDSQRLDEACAHSTWIGATSEQNDHLRVSIVRPRTRRAPRAASRPRSSSVPVRERRPGRTSGPPATMSPMPGEGSVAVQCGTSGTSAMRTATSGSSPPAPEPLGSGWREPRSPVASGKGRRVRGRRRTHTRRRRTARRTGTHSWPSRSPAREAS